MASRAHIWPFLASTIETWEKQRTSKSYFDQWTIYKDLREDLRVQKRRGQASLMASRAHIYPLWKEGKNISAHLKILFKPMEYIRGPLQRSQMCQANIIFI